jgi:hypothetical protein
MKGISLEVGTIVVLALDGTLVYVEEVQPTFASVVALPEQFAERSDERVFTPGKVSAKKISPYSQADRKLSVSELTERNREFIGTYEKLRQQHGPHHIVKDPNAPTPVAKTKRVKKTPEEKQAAKKAKRDAKKVAPKYKDRCVVCNEQQGHPSHPTDHAFVAPDNATITPAPKAPRAPKAATTTGARVFVLAQDYTLDAARAMPRGEKYAEGNRSFRIVKALEGLPARTGTLEQVVDALGAAGGKNPEKNSRRVLNQLTTSEYGAIVTVQA